MPRIGMGCRTRTVRRTDVAHRLPRRADTDRQSSGACAARERSIQSGRARFIGDAMEENLDELCSGAGELGLRSIPAFMFQEGDDPVCEQAFREIARLSRGAYCRFAPGAAHELAELLRAAAAYAAGGMKALADLQKRQSTGAGRLIRECKYPA